MYNSNNLNHPGPGSYNYSVEKIKRDPKRFRFGKAARNIGMINSKGIPGPGYYNQDYMKYKKKGKGYSFGKSARIQNLKNNNDLGPGSYHVKNDTFKNKFGFIGKARRSLNKVTNQTPGYYDVPVTVPNLSMYHYANNRRK
jgi:hypothetical protein